MKIGALLGVLGASFTLIATAQQSVSVGDVVVPRGQLEARDDHPSTFSITLADTVVTIEPTQEYIVREVATVESILLRERYYLRIEEYDFDGPCQDTACWVYLGAESSDRASNLVRSSKSTDPEPSVGPDTESSRSTS